MRIIKLRSRWGFIMTAVLIEKENVDLLVVKFEYQPELVEKIKTIDGRNWNFERKHWALPNTETVLEKICEVFSDEDLFIDGALISPIDKKPQQTQSHDMVGDAQILKELDKELTLRGYSIKTRKSYGGDIHRYLQYCLKRPLDMNEADIKEYLLQLIDDQALSHEYVDQSISALRFLYKSIFHKPNIVSDIPRPKGNAIYRKF